MKKFWITLLSILALTFSLFGAVACKSGSDAFAKYTLKENGFLVYEDFELPSKIGDKSVSWTSDNTAITVEKRSGADYLAKVTLGDEAVNTKLTVKSGKNKKDFSVTVGALDVSYFVKKFTFENNNATVFEDFELPTSITLFEKTATIKWSVDRDQDKGLISVVEEGGKTLCKVNQSSLNPTVKLFAEFEYNGNKQKTNFDMTVSFERTHIEEVDYWYYNTGVSIKMSGYVVAIGTAYSTSYGNVTLYMVDDDFCAGYYLYRVKATKEDGALLKPGVHVTVTGTTNTNFSGLIETNAGGTLVVDKDIEEIDVTEHVYALDKDLLAHSRESIYHTSSLVSLTNWKIKSMYNEAPKEGSTSTLFTLEKGGVEVSVAISKYMEGVYATKNSDETYSALAALYTSLQVGDVVSVTGILGNYNGFQIMPLKAADVVKAEDPAAESAVPEACTKVASAIEKVEALFKDKGITSVSEEKKVFKPDSGYIIVADQEIELPTEDGVEIKCETIHGSGTVSVEGNKLIITVGAEDMASLKVTYTVKDGDDKVLYSTSTYHIVHSMKMDDQAIVEKLRFDFVLETTSTVVDPVELTTSVKEYPSATISWALKEPVEGVKVEDNTIIVEQPDTEKDRKIVLVATFTSGEKHVEKEYDFTVGQAIPFEAGTYKLAVEQKNLKKTLYFTGEMSGNFGATSEFYIDAVDVVVAEVEAGSTYTLKVGDKYLELDSAHHIALVETKTGEWKYDYSLKVFTWTVTAESKTYYLGTYNTFDTISASETWRISGTNASAVGDSQFVAFFEEPKQLSEEEIAAQKKYQDAAKALNAIGKIDDITEAGSITLPASTVEGVTLTWALAEDNAATSAKLSGSTLTVTTMPEATETVTLTVTATCGDATREKTVTVTVKVQQQAATFEEGTYKLAVQQNGLTPPKKLYFTGAMDTSQTYYGGLTESVASGADIEVKAVTGGYTFKVVSSGKYIELVVSNNYVNFALVDTASTTIAWVYNGDLETFTWTNEKGTYYLGTRSTYTTLSASQISYITGGNAENVGVSQFVAKFEKYTTEGMTDEQKVDAAIEVLNENPLNTYIFKTGEITLPTASDVTITWSSNNPEYVTIVENTKMNVLKLAETDTVPVTITASVNSGSVTKPVEFNLTITAPVNYGTENEPLSVTEALAIVSAQVKKTGDWTAEVVYMTGKVTNVVVDKNRTNITVEDLNNKGTTILAFDSQLQSGVEGTLLVQNNVVIISGYITSYNYTSGLDASEGTIEFSKKDSTLVYVESITLGTSKITLGDHEGATVTIPETNVTNGDEVTITFAPETDMIIDAVKVNGTEISEEALEAGTYTFTVAGDVTVTVETHKDGDSKPATLYTLTPTGDSKVTAYAGNGNVKVGDIIWNVEGNSTLTVNSSAAWGFGGKTKNSETADHQDRKLTSIDRIPGKVTQLEISFDCDASGITVHSVTLMVYSFAPKTITKDSNDKDVVTDTDAVAISTLDITSAYTNAMEATVHTATIKADKDWTNCYYQLVFNISVPGSSNKKVSVTGITFIGFAATTPDTGDNGDETENPGTETENEATEAKFYED